VIQKLKCLNNWDLTSLTFSSCLIKYFQIKPNFYINPHFFLQKRI
jgi:hypothetical protein